ncbi:MAG: HmuY family protein [Bacteroidales bacterium]|jgi:hypothetical protein|nr:HmuY family protein [Bacteroidales bacterium]
MKNFKIKNAIMIIATVIIFGACEKDETVDPVALESVTVMVEATSYYDWVYFSFTTGDIVEVTDPATSTSWDIGLKRNHFSTNSGSSGNGAGGAFDAGVVDFDTYFEAPETGYTVDDSIQAFDFAIMTYVSSAANTVLETWGTFTEEQPPTLEPSNKVFVVKTAEGNYVKMIVQNYYGTEGSGYITFKYVYQPDGSTNLK